MRTVGLPAQIFLFGCALVFGATRVGGRTTTTSGR